jgi:hypothetical protein
MPAKKLECTSFKIITEIHPNRLTRNHQHQLNQKPMTRSQPTKILKPNDETATKECQQIQR